MSNAKIEAAAKATDTIIDAWYDAQKALGSRLLTNGYGVLADPSMVRSDIGTAITALRKAQAAMDAAKWPTNADYDLIDG